MPADFEDELWVEPDGDVVGFDRVFDEGDVDVRCVTGAVPSVAAEEVGVLGASGFDGVLEGHALGDASAFAARAVQGSLQVVVVHPSTLTGSGT
nr:hypothetical protein [Nocardia jiangxiensis]